LFAEDLPFKVVRINGQDEILARATKQLIGRAGYETAIPLFPQDAIQYRNGAQIIASANEKGADR
jgi:hypothetical protein